MNRLSLRQFDVADVCLQNSFCTSREIACSLNDVPLNLSFEVGRMGSQPVDTASARPSPAVTVKLAIGGAFAWIGLDDLGAFPQLSNLLGGVELSSLPADVQVLVAEVVFESALGTLSQILGRDVAIAEVLPSRFSQPEPWNVDLLLRTPDHQTRAHLAFGDDLRELFGDAIRKTAASPVALWGGLPLVATVEFGKTRLTLTELKGLRRLDVLMVEQRCGETSASVILNFGSSAVIPAQLDGAQVTIAGPARAAASAGTDDVQPGELLHSAGDEQSPDGVHPLDGVPVEVVFEHGEVCMTLDELRSVATGATIELALPADGQRVGLRSGGRRLGVGELAPIGNRLGVRLLELN